MEERMMDGAHPVVDGVRPVDVHFEPYSPEQVNRYSEHINEIRQSCPVAWSDGHWSPTDTGFWLLTRYRDVRDAGVNWRLYSSAQGASPVQFDLNVLRMVPLETDPPLHTHIRGKIAHFFSHAALNVHEDRIRAIVQELLADCIGQSPADFVRKFSIALPSRVFFETIFGEDPKAIGWLIEAVEEMFEDATKAAEAAPRIMQWCSEALEARRRSGVKDDILGVIAHAGNEPDFKLDELQRVQTVLLLIMAGMETTANAIGAIVLTMATEPEIRTKLAGADAGVIYKAVDEFLRFSTPVPAAGRTLTADAEISGCPMRKGERVMLSWMGANHDPEAYPNPDSLDLDRNASQHLAFGVGHHKCLGMHLARRELRLTIEELCRLSVLELVPGTELSYRTGPARGLVTLPIRCER